MTVNDNRAEVEPGDDGPSLTPEETFAVLQNLMPDDPSIASAVSWRTDDDGKEKRACLEMTIATHPERCAWVQSSGDTWFVLSIDEGFGTLVISEDATADEARAYLEEWVDAGVSYLGSGALSSTRGIFKVPIRIIEREGREPLTLIMDFRDELRFVFRRWRKN